MIRLLNRNPPLLLLALLLLSSCAGKETVLITTDREPPKSRVEAPFKKVPKSDQVPPTQKPYRINGRTYYPLPTAQGFEETGIASWYGADFHGRKTSNGETYDMHGLTAAHKTLPMDTWLLVRNQENGREITVRVNDRGPFVKERIIDLTKTGAGNLEFMNQGTARVKITALGEAETYRYGGVATERFKTHPDFQSGEFYIQIGSFTVEDNAQRLKEQMLAGGRKALIRKFDRGDQIFYRVQIRAGHNLPAAREVQRIMEESGFPGAFVVAR
jgi:rare lipoprotein A